MNEPVITNLKEGDLFTVVPRVDSHMAKIGDRSYQGDIFLLLKIERLNPERVVYIGEKLIRKISQKKDIVTRYDLGTIGREYSQSQFMQHEYNIYKYEGDAKLELPSDLEAVESSVAGEK